MKDAKKKQKQRKTLPTVAAQNVASNVQIMLHALLKNPGKYFVIVSLALRVIDANCVIQTQFVRMEANVRLGWADVIVHQDFMGRYVK